MNDLKRNPVRILILTCFLLISTFIIASASSEAFADSYLVKGENEDEIESEMISTTGFNSATLHLIKFPTGTTTVSFKYQGEIQPDILYEAAGMNATSTNGRRYSSSTYLKDGWWTIDVSKLNPSVGNGKWYAALQSKNKLVKQAEYYELINPATDNSRTEHLFIQVGDENSPLDVVAFMNNDANHPDEAGTEFEDHYWIDLILKGGKRNYFFDFDEMNQEIFYTIDGSDPTTSGTVKKYSDVEPISDDPNDQDAQSNRIIKITKSCIVKAVTKVGDNWGKVSEINCTVAPMPVFSKKGGYYSGEQTISITCSLDNADIWYTLCPDYIEDPEFSFIDEYGNLIDDEENIIKYEGPLTISEDCAIKAIAVNDEQHSLVAMEEYILSTGIDVAFNGDDQGVWLQDYSIHTDCTGTIVTPYGHDKCRIIVSADPNATIKLNGEEIQREETGDNAGKFLLDLDVLQDAAEPDQGAENIIGVSWGYWGYTEYTIYCIASIYPDVPDKVTDYFVPASQFTNNGLYGTAPNRTLIGKPDFNNGSSLGNFGGYIVWKYDEGIKNDPNNPYGVDFIVFGNSFDGTNEAAEPGNIMVSKDREHWYTLAGSIHYDDNVLWNKQVTYTENHEFADYNIEDLKSGKSRFLYPNTFYYPLHMIENDFTSFSTTGNYLIPVDGLNAFGNTRPPYPAFGFADVGGSRHCSNEAENPYGGIVRDGTYTDRVTTNRNGDACDISWAVDENGNPVQLDEIHYVKVQTASFIDNGAIGEKSTEVNVMRIAKPAESAVGVTDAPSSIKIDGTEVALKPGEVVNVTVDGIFDIAVDAPETANVYINSLRSHTAFMDKAPQGIVRVIVQEGEKEPLIYYFKINQNAQQTSKKVTAVTFDTGKGLMHDKEKLTCYFDADTIEHLGVDGKVAFPKAVSPKESEGFAYWYNEDTEKQYTSYNADNATKLNGKTLIAVYGKADDVEAASAVAEAIEDLPEAEALTLEDADAVKAAQKAYSDLKDDQKKLISDADKTKLALASAVIGKLEAEATAADLQTQLSDAQSALTTAQNKVSELEGTVSALQGQLKDAQDAVTEAQAKYDELKTDSDADKEELARAKADLEAAKAAEKEAQDNLDAAKEDLTKAQAKAAELEEKVSGLQKDLVAEESEIAALKEKNAILKKTVKKLKAKAKKKSALVSWKKTGAGFTYEVYRATNPVKKFKKVKTSKKLKVTVKKLKKGKTYYFKVRAFKKVNGKKVYTGWSNIAKAKIKK